MYRKGHTLYAMRDEARVKGSLTIRTWSPDGLLVSNERYDNVITTAGKSIFAKLVGGIAATAFDRIALGTGTTAELASDTALETEITDTGLARVQDATPASSGAILTIDYSWTATGVKVVTEAGLFNAASGPTMAARKTFSEKTTSNGSVIQVIWNITFA